MREELLSQCNGSRCPAAIAGRARRAPGERAGAPPVRWNAFAL